MIPIGIFCPWQCRIPHIRVPHWRPRAPMNRLIPTLLKPYFFMKVMRKPNPTNIITCTSWNTAKEQREKIVRGVLRKCYIIVDPIYLMLHPLHTTLQRECINWAAKAWVLVPAWLLTSHETLGKFSVFEPLLGTLGTNISVLFIVCLLSSP